jgi:microcystin-dependent protein
MAAHWNLSGIQYVDPNGWPYVGARAYFYEAGTTTPIDVYRDFALTEIFSTPVEADGIGVFPDVYLNEDDEFYRIVVTTSEGKKIRDSDSIPIIGSNMASGGTVVVNQAVMTTGDIKPRFDSDSLTGFVRCTGGTIGSVASLGSERANNDTEALFLFLWNKNAGLTVSGGRGASAAADWTANKTIALPDLRRRTLIGIGEGGSLGTTGGAETHTLTLAQMPTHTHTGSVSLDNHAHTYTTRNSLETIREGSSTQVSNLWKGSLADDTGAAGAGSESFTTAAAGGSASHNIMQPYMTITYYMKL